jgi:hypothetical protein
MFEGRPGFKPRTFPPAQLQRRFVSLSGIFFSSFADIAVRQIVDRFHSAGADLDRFGPILDFGCDCGRIARTSKELYPAIVFWGCDIDSDAMDWCVSNISGTANFHATEVLPPLPFEDKFFDAVYSVSIFTHMPEKGMPEFYKNSFHSSRYVRERWSEFFAVMDIAAFRPEHPAECRTVPQTTRRRRTRFFGTALFSCGKKLCGRDLCRLNGFMRCTAPRSVTLRHDWQKPNEPWVKRSGSPCEVDEVAALTRQIQETEAGITEAAHSPMNR